MWRKLTMYVHSTNLDFPIQILSFSSWYAAVIRHGTLLSQWMRRQLLETSTVEALPDIKLSYFDVGVEVTKFVAVLILFNGKFSTFCGLGQTGKHQPSWFSQQASHHTTLSSYIAWLLAGVLSKVDFLHCNACVACQGKNRSKFVSFSCEIKAYCVFLLCASIISGPLRLNFKILRHFFTCKLTCIAYLDNISLKVPVVLCLFL